MAFSIPRNAPNFSSNQRQYEDAYWPSSGRSKYSISPRSGLSISPFGAFRGDRELPMYKDKPYNYPFSRRSRGRNFWIVVVLLLIVGWYFIVPRLFRHQRNSTSGRSLENFTGRAKGSREWAEKRAAVVQAMEKSWGGYEKHAWGKSRVRLVPKPLTLSLRI
jgi:endoplasmic reticulum Man9GlcNAc2 1,2-alpha-mannosidase